MLGGWMKGRRYELVVYITFRMMTMHQCFLEDPILSVYQCHKMSIVFRSLKTPHPLTSILFHTST